MTRWAKHPTQKLVGSQVWTITATRQAVYIVVFADHRVGIFDMEKDLVTEGILCNGSYYLDVES